MKLKKSFLICIILLAVFSIGIASAQENTTSDTLDEATPDVIEKSPIEDVLTANESSAKELIKDYEVSIPSETYDRGLDLISVINMPKDATGNISISIDNIERYNQKASVGGNALFIGDLNLNYGNHMVLINYTGDDKYAGFTNTGEFEKIENNYLHTKYRIDDITYGAESRFIWKMYFDIFVWLDDGVKGNIKIIVDNETIYNKKYNGEIHTYGTLDKNAYGKHTYEVRYYNGNQKSVTKKGTFTIPMCLASDYSPTIDYGDSVTFKFQLPDEGYGVARLGNETYPFDFKGSDTKVTLSNFSEGDNIVEFTFYDRKGYNETHTYHVYVTPKPHNLTIEFLESYETYVWNSNPAVRLYVYGSEYKPLGGNVTVYLDGELLTVLDQQVEWRYNPGPVFDYHDFPMGSAGNHTVTAVYSGDATYNATNKTFTYETKYYHCTIFETTGEGRISLPSDAKCNTIMCIINGKTYDLKPELRNRGSYKEYDFSFGNLLSKNGGNELTVCYQGNSKYPSFSKPYYILETGRAIEGDDCVKIKYGQSRQIEMADKGNATLVLYVGETELLYEMPIAEFDLKQNSTILISKEVIDEALKSNYTKLLLEKNYKNYGDYFLNLYTRIYNDDGREYLHTIDVYFTAKLSDANDITMQYSQSKTFTAKAYDIYGKQAGANEIVKIKIGKKTFTAKTDKNGNIKFKIPNTITPGKYNIIATYKNAKITKKLTVKQILTIKTIKVKKSAKKLTLTATLKKINGKYLKNKKITFKFNGKTYKTKTNSKGIAKVTIKSKVLQKLKVGKKVTYQATYIKDTVKKRVKVGK